MKEDLNRIYIRLLNIQGMSAAKKYEIQNTFTEKKGSLEILAMVETHIKDDRYLWDQNWKEYEQRRDVNDKKGGGLLVLHKVNDHIKLEKQKEENKDILIVRGRIGQHKLKLVLIYMATRSSNDSKERNRKITRSNGWYQTK